MSFKYRLPADYEIVKIPTNKARRAECIQLSEYLKDSLYDLTRIDGIVSYGIGISKTNWCPPTHSLRRRFWPWPKQLSMGNG